MPVDEGLAARVAPLLDDVGRCDTEILGGLAYPVDGNTSVGIGSDLIVRVGVEGYPEAVAEPGGLFDATGRLEPGWMVSAEATNGGAELAAAWVQRGVAYADTLSLK